MFEELQLRVVFLVRVFAALISHCEHKPFSRSDIGGRRSLIGARLPIWRRCGGRQPGGVVGVYLNRVSDWMSGRSLPLTRLARE